MNENFAKLAEALYIADRKAREAVEARAQLEKRLAQREKEKKEEHLRMLAQRARDHRAGEILSFCFIVAPHVTLGDVIRGPYWAHTIEYLIAHKI